MADIISNRTGEILVTENQIQNLISEGTELLRQFEYEDGMNYPTDYVDKIIRTSLENKREIIEVLSKHPNWNKEKLMIVFSHDYERGILKDAANEAYNDLYNMGVRNILPKKVKTPYSPYELNCLVRSALKKLEVVDNYSWLKSFVPIKSLKDEYERLRNLKFKLNSEFSEFDYDDWNYFTNREDLERWLKLRKTLRLFEDYGCVQYPTDYFVGMLSELCPEIKGITTETKMTRVFGKVAKYFGLDKVEGYNAAFPRLGDALNPIKVKRHTIVSCNPIDYWTMSFGDTWCSCHNIDKTHLRESSRLGMYGDGCCSSGTESYMLDESSVVFYTVDAKYDGIDYEMQDKKNRQMYHIGKNKFIQGRLYPQGNDGADEAYAETRAIMQKVMAECFEMPNLWVYKKGTSRCAEISESTGTHYRDYEHFDNCSVSYIKLNEYGNIDRDVKIHIGHYPICPGCGGEHSYQENIVCLDCRGHKCEICGDDAETYCEDEEEWRCTEHSFYCDYHERYEVYDSNHEFYHVDGYGDVCEEAINHSGDFVQCYNCDDYIYTESDDYVRINDRYYCCEDCAVNDGWRYCNCCDEWVSEDDYNEEQDMCNNCAESEEQE